jgi:hypothetical protein
MEGKPIIVEIRFKDFEIDHLWYAKIFNIYNKNNLTLGVSFFLANILFKVFVLKQSLNCAQILTNIRGILHCSHWIEWSQNNLPLIVSKRKI